MCKKSSPQSVLLKIYVCQLSVGPKLANIPPYYVLWVQILNGSGIFSHSLAKLANMVQGKKVDKHTPPPSRGGLINQSIHIYN